MDVDVDELLEQLGVDLPSSRTVNCPVHEDVTASFHIYPDGGIHCFGCGLNGGPVELVRAFTGANYWEAVAWLGGIIGDFDPAEKHEPKRKPLQDFSATFLKEPAGSQADVDAAQRLIDDKWPGLTIDDLRKYGVAVKRYALWVPFWHELWMVGIKTRSLTPGGKKLSIPGSVFTTGFYSVGGDGKNGVALITEGEGDTWLATKLLPHIGVFGLPSGASAWHDRWLDEIVKAHRMVHVATDPDSAGEKAADRILEACETKKLEARRLLPPHGDFSDSVKQGWRPEL